VIRIDGENPKAFFNFVADLAVARVDPEALPQLED